MDKQGWTHIKVVQDLLPRVQEKLVIDPCVKPLCSFLNMCLLDTMIYKNI